MNPFLPSSIVSLDLAAVPYQSSAVARLSDPLLRARLRVRVVDNRAFGGDAREAFETLVRSLSDSGPSWSFEQYLAASGFVPPKVKRELSGFYTAQGRVLITPHLHDPADLDERARAFYELDDTLARHGVAAELLQVLDWALLPHKGAWAAARVKALQSANFIDYSFEEFCLGVAMSGFWPQLRALRQPLLAPWLMGVRPVRHLERFFALHQGLPDELAYVALSVAAGGHLICRQSDAALGGLLGAAQAAHLVQVRPHGKDLLNTRRSWHLAHEIWDTEALRML
jgi:hypothetical protein